MNNKFGLETVAYLTKLDLEDTLNPRVYCSNDSRYGIFYDLFTQYPKSFRRIKVLR